MLDYNQNSLTLYQGKFFERRVFVEIILILKYAGCGLIGGGIGLLLRESKFVAVLVFVGFLLILFSSAIPQGKPASLDTLKTGKKYTVVAICDRKYIVTKSIDGKEMRLIGPIETNIKIGNDDVYLKTKEGFEAIKK